MNQTCPICENEFAQLDSHHIYPIAFGGPQEGPQVSLCAGCHQGIHSQARQAAAKKPKSKNYLPTPESLQRAAFLINSILRAEQNYKRGVVPEGFDSNIHQVSCWMDRDKLRLLHSAKNILGFKSLDAMLNAMTNSIIAKAHGIDTGPLGQGVNQYVLDPRRPKQIPTYPQATKGTDATAQGRKKP